MQRRSKIALAFLALLLVLVIGVCISKGKVALDRRARIEMLYMGPGVELQEFAGAHDMRFPTVDYDRGRLQPRRSWVSNATPDNEFLNGFYYLGFPAESEAALLAFLAAPRYAPTGGWPVGESVETARVRNRIPLLVERPTAPAQDLLVLFADNHVAVMPYPGEYPVSAAAIAAMQAWEQRYARGNPTP